MRRPWKQHREDEVERLLRANRAEPRDEFVTSLLERLETRQRRFRPQRIGGRVLVAVAVTALAVGAGVAAGAPHVAGTSISNLVHVGQPHGNAGQGQNGSDIKNSPSAGDHQYAVELCHHTHSTTNPWVDLFLSPQGAANHLKHHPMDFIVGAPGNPTTCPP
ncbi:MAG TPA: hypothetical protein VJ838_00030 [Gaiellaceae bacterium]|nr:hypothetical protein [Gaiellaceae bacterium]